MLLIFVGVLCFAIGRFMGFIDGVHHEYHKKLWANDVFLDTMWGTVKEVFFSSSGHKQ